MLYQRNRLCRNSLRNIREMKKVLVAAAAESFYLSSPVNHHLSIITCQSSPVNHHLIRIPSGLREEIQKRMTYYFCIVLF